MTIWDGGGNDAYDFSNFTTNMSIDLNPGPGRSSTPAPRIGSGRILASIR